MSSNPRPLAPAPRPRPDDSDSARDPGLAPVRKKPKTTVRFVCDGCRAKKTACDARQPSCTPCIKRRTQCTYPPLKETDQLRHKVDGMRKALADHEELLGHLKTVPDEEAAKVLRQLRTARDISAFLSSIKGSTHSKGRPSDLALARNILPPARNRVILELMALYRMAYPKLIPVDIANIILKPRTQASRFGSPQLKAKEAEVSDLETTVPGDVLQRRNDSSNAWWDFAAPLVREMTPPAKASSTSPLLGPAKPAVYADDRLRQLKMDYWTRVPISDEFAATIMSKYLEVEHPMQAWFDADLFIGSLVNCDLTFCSPFLASAFLFSACIAYSPIDIRASALSHAFFKETAMLYKAERLSSSLPNVAALHAFSQACISSGHVEVLPQLNVDGRHMAERMKLFGISPEEAAANPRFMNSSPEMQQATAHAAWASHYSLYYKCVPILFPPMFPVPGGNISDDEESSFENPLGWKSYPLAPYMGAVFPALCGMWLIAQEIISAYYHDHEIPVADRVPLAFAESKYRRLLAWTTRLDPMLTCHEEKTLATVLILHMHLHSIILVIFRPFLQNESKNSALRSFSATYASPLAICNASLDQVRRLALRCHLDYPGELISIVSMSAYLNLGGATVGAVEGEAMSAEEKRFYFKLCMCYWQETMIGHPVTMGVVEGLLAMAMKRQGMNGSVARRLLEVVKSLGQHHGKLEASAGLMKIDYDLAQVNPSGATADSLGTELKKLVLMDEFLVDDDKESWDG
ncbi:hypothetical protein S40293_10140 [Stachybotrys chartarum IBT 40293]|nr:hypothetical protein S40293_10140 [Stachybotrys chartarum IBT 40293]